MTAVCLKIALIILAVFGVKKPQFTNANSVCYSFHLEEVTDVENPHFAGSIWNYFDKADLAREQPKCAVKLLLILAGDVELCPGPNTGLGNLLQYKGFSMLHQNIRGLSGKRDLLTELLFNHSSVDILGLSETWTKPDSIDDLSIPGYNYERKDTVAGSGGGVGMFIKDVCIDVS